MSEIRAFTKGATNKRINQDYAITTGNIVVCFDGCGSCENSQVGVHKMAEIILDNSNNITVDNFENFVLENLYELVLANSHKERCETELFFTILACIETDEKFVVFTCGDGYIITVSHEQQIQYFKLNNNTTIHDGGAPGYPIYNFMPVVDAYNTNIRFRKVEFDKLEYKYVYLSSDGLRFIVERQFPQKEKKKFEDALMEGNVLKISTVVEKNATYIKDDFSIARN